MKKTIKEMFNEVITMAENSGADNATEIIAFANERIEKLEKKATATGEKKLTVKQKENLGIGDTITAILADAEKAMTIKEILATGKITVADISNQRMSAILKRLVDTGVVVRETAGKITTFKIA